MDTTIRWLQRSINNGGSSAHFGVWGKWSKPYPETSGYIIPTLLDYSRHGDAASYQAAVSLGEWLLLIQDREGFWHGGLHPPNKANPSVFNTGQILLGLVALGERTGDKKWLESAHSGARWLADNVNSQGQWEVGNYRRNFNPSYYTRVAWPMLATWRVTGDAHLRASAVRVLEKVVSRRLENGAFQDWSFAPGKPAFTHTIAYTLRGLLESAILLDDWSRFGSPVESALERLYRQAELRGGRLAGAYHESWKPVTWYTCLTGNAQVAICLLKYEGLFPDLRLVNAACKLADTVCASQWLGHPITGIRGGVAGSSPVWGRYLSLRYPNWAAKFHCDALMLLSERLRKEGL